MITLDDYFAGYPASTEIQDKHRIAAAELLARVNALLQEAEDEGGVEIESNPYTLTNVSGIRDGGWRPQACPTGAPNSAHKAGMAVDVYDPSNKLDKWITDEILEKYNLYREHPSATPRWCHLSTRRPSSGRRTFFP